MGFNRMLGDYWRCRCCKNIWFFGLGHKNYHFMHVYAGLAGGSISWGNVSQTGQQLARSTSPACAWTSVFVWLKFSFKIYEIIDDFLKPPTFFYVTKLPRILNAHRSLMIIFLASIDGFYGCTAIFCRHEYIEPSALRRTFIKLCHNHAGIRAN